MAMNWRRIATDGNGADTGNDDDDNLRTYVRTYLHTYVRRYVPTYVGRVMIAMTTILAEGVEEPETCMYVGTYVKTYTRTYLRPFVHKYVRR